MFEDVSQAPQREGIRGFINRHFGRPEDLDEARTELTSVATIFSGLGLLRVILAALLGLLPVLVEGAIVAVLALILRYTQSRAAAITLLVLTGINAALAFPSFWAFVWLLFAIRGFQLTMAASRFKHIQRLAPTDPSLPPGDDPSNPYRVSKREVHRA